MSQDEDDAIHAARALLAGRPLKIPTEALLSRLKTEGYAQRDLGDVSRALDAIRIGNAIEKLRGAAPGSEKRIVVLQLARSVRPYLTDRKPGWFRFLLTLGTPKSDVPFHLSYVRRLKSKAAQPKSALDRAVHLSRHLNDMLVAGSILSRMGANGKNDQRVKIVHAIGAAINAGEITTDEDAAQRAWHRFRKSCDHSTYRLEKYQGSIKAYRGRWVAFPASGTGLPTLPSPNGGRPRKT